MSGNANQLGGRRAPPSRSSRTAARRSELGADPLVAEYDRGPFPALYVPAFPSHLVRLVERATGRPFDPELFAAYERARAFTGYPGPLLEADVSSRQLLTDPRPDAPGPTPAPAGRPPGLASSSPADRMVHRGGIDPSDLGD